MPRPLSLSTHSLWSLWMLGQWCKRRQVCRHRIIMTTVRIALRGKASRNPSTGGLRLSLLLFLTPVSSENTNCLTACATKTGALLHLHNHPTKKPSFPLTKLHIDSPLLAFSLALFSHSRSINTFYNATYITSCIPHAQ